MVNKLELEMDKEAGIEEFLTSFNFQATLVFKEQIGYFLKNLVLLDTNPKSQK